MELDPNLFRDSAVSTEQKEENQKTAQSLAQQPKTYELPPSETRRRRVEGHGRQSPPVFLNDIVEQISCSGLDEDPDVGLRIFKPDRISGVLLWIHGGGWVLGRADLQDEALWKIAQEAEVAVVSVEYRLAPEYPYPAGPNDCEAAALWLIENASSKFGTENLCIGGGSAGGHLAAVTLLRMRDKHSYTHWKGADMVYGAYELSGAIPSQRYIGGSSPIIDTDTMNWFYDQFLQNGEDRTDPDISPLNARLDNLPPALFTIGTLDPLLDDSLFMHSRWIAAGNQSEIAIYPGGLPAFNNGETELARTANDRRIEAIRSWIA